MQHRPPLIPYSSFAFAAVPPELPTRREGDTGSLERVAHAEAADEHERGITLVGATQNDEPVTASITVIAPGVVCILLEDREHDPNRVTLAGDVSWLDVRPRRRAANPGKRRIGASRIPRRNLPGERPQATTRSS